MTFLLMDVHRFVRYLSGITSAGRSIALHVGISRMCI